MTCEGCFNEQEVLSLRISKHKRKLEEESRGNQKKKRIMLSCGGDHDKLMKDENCKVRSNVTLAHIFVVVVVVF